MKKFFKRLGLIICAFYVAFSLFTIACMQNMPEEFNDPTPFIILAVLFSIPILIWLKNRIFPPKTRHANSTDPWERFLHIRTEIHQLPPRKAERQEIGIILDSLHLIVSTDNPETYLTRFRLMQSHLEQARRKRFTPSEKKILLLANEAVQYKTFFNDDFLQRFFTRIEKEFMDLKAVKAKQKRIEKFQDFLQQNPSFQNEKSEVLLRKLTAMAPYIAVSPAPRKSTSEYSIGNLKNTMVSDFHIPDHIFQLLWFENGPIRNISRNVNEPSAIDPILPIVAPVNEPDKPTYYPRYRELSPEQRWIYLNWLCDITQPVDIGYVFIFYYGLERWLFTDRWRQAVQIIRQLRQYFDNKSFQGYSSDALVYIATVGPHPELFEDAELLSNYPAFFALKNGYLPIDTLLANARRFGFTNTRYLTGQNAHLDLFRQALQSELQRRYNRDVLPITEDDLVDCRKSATLMLANYSLKEREFAIKDITFCPIVCEKAFQVLNAAHQAVKELLADIRKQIK